MAQTNEEILLSNIVSNTTSPIIPFWVDNNDNYGKPSTFVTDFKKPSNFGVGIPSVYDQILIEMAEAVTETRAVSFTSPSMITAEIGTRLAAILSELDTTYDTALSTVLAEVIDVKIDSQCISDSLGALVKTVKKIRIVANIWISE